MGPTTGPTKSGFNPEHSDFTAALPLPYRVGFIITLGIWAWGLNLLWLSAFRIDVNYLIKYTPKNSPGSPSHQRVFRLAAIAQILLAVSVVIFWILTRHDFQAIDRYWWWPITYLISLLALLVLPLPGLASFSNGRRHFIATLKRLACGNIAETKDGRFGDLLLADALTSYAKVLGDIIVCIYALWNGLEEGKDSRGGVNWLYPFLVAIPFVIRMSQCIVEMRRVRQASNATGFQHLANALKYATAFPVIVLLFLERKQFASPSEDDALRANYLHWWKIAITINSMYSFWWDVVKDWDLPVFSDALGSILGRERDHERRAWGLRQNIYFQPGVYYAVIVLDFALRLTWLNKLSSGKTKELVDTEAGIFLLEILEVFRRWVWIFFRVETEWTRSNVGPLHGDILLGGFSR